MARPMQAVVVAVLAVVAAYGLVGHTRVLLAVLAPALFLAATALATRRPRETTAAALVALALFPFLAAPAKGPIVFDPATMLLWVAALSTTVAAGLKRGGTGFTALDGVVGLFFLALLLSVVSRVNPAREFERLVWLWGGPYLAGRMLLRHCVAGATFARILAGAACLLAPFLVIEVALHVNLLLQAFPSAVNAEAQLGTTFSRLGAIRIQGSFGQPIPLAMFLSSAAVAAVAVGLATDTRRTRTWWFAAAGGLILLQAATLARIGWLLLVIALIWLALLQPKRIVRRGGAGLVLLVLGTVLLVGAFGPARQLVLGSSNTKAAKSVAASAAYRSQLLNYASRPGVLQPFGSQAVFIGPRGNRSIDNAYIGVALRWGVIAAIGLVMVAAGVVWTGIRHRRSFWVVTFSGIALAQMIVLVGVGLITQQQILIWLTIGACAGAAVAASDDQARAVTKI